MCFINFLVSYKRFLFLYIHISRTSEEAKRGEQKNVQSDREIRRPIRKSDEVVGISEDYGRRISEFPYRDESLRRISIDLISLQSTEPSGSRQLLFFGFQVNPIKKISRVSRA